MASYTDANAANRRAMTYQPSHVPPVLHARPAGRGHLFTVLLLMLMVGGCLPSCQRTQPTALFPSDSTSRRIAQKTSVDTLRRIDQTAGTKAHTLAYPRTVRYGPGGRLYVSDVETNSIFVFTGSGRFVREIALPAFAYPYLAGMRGDTLLVFNPQAGRVDFVVDERIARSLTTPDAPSEEALQYIAASDSALYFKLTGRDVDGYLARLDEQGRVAARHTLPGPYWRQAGLLRMWGDSLVSLSGFRPVVDVLAPGGTLDTMALQGFDSPMLARSHAYATGDADRPPLLTASAVPIDDRLFVLNMRPGWLRIDVYDRSGHLEQILTERRPTPGTQYYPIDLAVRQAETGGYEIAVITVKPEPKLMRYRWRPGAPA